MALVRSWALTAMGSIWQPATTETNYGTYEKVASYQQQGH